MLVRRWIKFVLFDVWYFHVKLVDFFMLSALISSKKSIVNSISNLNYSILTPTLLLKIIFQDVFLMVWWLNKDNFLVQLVLVKTWWLFILALWYLLRGAVIIFWYEPLLFQCSFIIRVVFSLNWFNSLCCLSNISSFRENLSSYLEKLDWIFFREIFWHKWWWWCINCGGLSRWIVVITGYVSCVCRGRHDEEYSFVGVLDWSVLIWRSYSCLKLF